MNQIREICSNSPTGRGRQCNPCFSKSVKSFYEDPDGLINIELIYNDNGPESNYFISGPTLMIKLFKKALIEKGVPTDNLLTDDWE